MPDDPSSVKRRSERERVQISVTLVIEGEDAEYLATAVDLSLHGVRLQSDASLTPGQPVGLLLATNPDCFIKARVVWVGKADNDRVGQAGFEFLDPIAGPVC
jgi:hypothetical protein